MPNRTRLGEILSEANCVLSDELNGLLDDAAFQGVRPLTLVEAETMSHIVLNIETAAELVRMLRRKVQDGARFPG